MNQSARQPVIGAAWSGIAGWMVVRISRMLRTDDRQTALSNFATVQALFSILDQLSLLHATIRICLRHESKKVQSLPTNV